MNFRLATKQDIRQLIEMRLAFIQEDTHLSDEQTNCLNNQFIEYFNKHIENDLNDLFTYVAEENEEIVSTVFMIVIERPANPNFLTGKIGTIFNVYTKKEFRKQGLAEKLLKMAIEDSKKMNLSYIDLKASQMGLPLYKKLGFKEEQSQCVPMKLTL